MRTTTVLHQQLFQLQRCFERSIEDLTYAGWRTRAAPNTNLLEYIFWHIAYNLNAFVQTLIRGEPELLSQEPWAMKDGPTPARRGMNVSLTEADVIAYHASRRSVQAYAEAVFQAVDAWLEGLTDNELDRAPIVQDISR